MMDLNIDKLDQFKIYTTKTTYNPIENRLNYLGFILVFRDRNYYQFLQNKRKIQKMHSLLIIFL